MTSTPSLDIQGAAPLLHFLDVKLGGTIQRSTLIPDIAFLIL